MRAISVATRCVMRDGNERLERGARLVELARLDGGGRHGDRALERVGAERRELAHAVETIARAVADARVGVGGREIGMRRAAPRPLQDLGGARRVPARGQQAAGDGGGGNEVGCEAMRFERQVQCALGIALLGGLRLRGEQHGAAAIGSWALDVAVLAGDGDGLQRAGPIAVAALQVEQGIDRPGKLRD